MPRLLCTRYRVTGAASDRARPIPSETAALRSAVETMEANEVIVVFYEDLDAVEQTLADLNATRATAVEPLRFQEDGTLAALRRA